MVAPVTIRSVGAAAPGLRLPASEVGTAWGARAGRGQAAVCLPDEDALTLSWLAIARALRAAGLEPADVDGLWWVTSRPPFNEGPSWSTLAAASRLRSTAAGALLSGS